MYLLDPERGRRRRHIFVDKAGKMLHQAERGVDIAFRDMGHRTRGILAEARAAFRREEPVRDDVLEARIRSRIGHIIRHPHFIEVKVRSGKVRLSGPVLQRHVIELIRAVESVPGVQSVENSLDPHDSPNGIPSLEVAMTQPPTRRSNLAPAYRLTMLLTGGLALVCGAGKRGVFGTLLAAAGISMAANAFWSSQSGAQNSNHAQQKSKDVDVLVLQ
jgi:hypothetical protein